MSLRDILGPSSLNQIVYVVLLWSAIILGIIYVYDTPVIRLEIVAGTTIILIWVVWAVRYRLEQIKQDWYER